MNSSQQTCSTTLDELFQIKYCFQLHFFEEKPFRKYEYPHNWKYKKKKKEEKKKSFAICHMKKQVITIILRYNHFIDLSIKCTIY